MRILIDARLYGLENAGIGRYETNLIKQLKKIDVDNEYIILLRKKYFDELNFPSNWQKVLADFKHYSISEQFKLISIISKYKPDITHFLHFNLPVLFSGKYVVTVHDLLMQKHRGASATTLPFYLYYPKHIGAKFVFSRGVKRANKVIVPSNSVKKEVEEYFKIKPEKIAVTYEGVDSQITSKTNSSILLKRYNLTSPYFLYVGSAYPHKNLERAVAAIIELNKDSKNKYFLAIACARNVFSERLEKLILKYDVEKFVKLLGFVTDEDLGTLYKNSLAFVFPSLSEGFGLPGLEAMKMGTLVLASDIPVFREIYEDNAIYFDPQNTSAIKNKMEEVISMPKTERNKRISEGEKFVEKYSWEQMAKETLQIYNSAL